MQAVMHAQVLVKIMFDMSMAIIMFIIDKTALQLNLSDPGLYGPSIPLRLPSESQRPKYAFHKQAAAWFSRPNIPQYIQVIQQTIFCCDKSPVHAYVDI